MTAPFVLRILSGAHSPLTFPNTRESRWAGSVVQTTLTLKSRSGVGEEKMEEKEEEEEVEKKVEAREEEEEL